MRGSPRRWIFRIAAIGIGLLPFLVTEAALRWLGTRRAHAPTPTVQFTTDRPLFVFEEQSAEYVIPASRQPFFKRDTFAAQKDPGEYRVFCLGGSTVQGNPYSIETSFTTWLELSLRAADPSRHWQVVNCGGISYASYRLYPILKECLQYKPDLFILYLGDNEFLEERSYPRDNIPQQFTWLDQSRLFHTARNLYRNQFQTKVSSSSSIRLADEVDALLDYQGGLAQYHRDDYWRAEVTNHFRLTLDRMVQEARSAGASVLLMDPVCNLKDCAPFKSEFEQPLVAGDKRRFEELLRLPVEPATADQQIDLLREAVRLDPRHAGSWYKLGQVYLDANQDDAAWEALIRAKDEDICPLRMIEPMRTIIAACGQTNGVRVVPVMDLFKEKSPHKIPGDELLLDHVHPSITGHQMIADLVVDVLAQQGIAKLGENWKQAQQQRYREHLATLDTPYYARGQEHLDGLRKWAQGRVKKLRGSPSPRK